jgi:hypothetical protein
MRRAFAAPVLADGSTMVHEIIAVLEVDIGGSTGFW